MSLGKTKLSQTIGRIKNNKDILCVKNSAEDWYNRNMFVYPTKSESLSELSAHTNELYTISPNERRK